MPNKIGRRDGGGGISGNFFIGFWVCGLLIDLIDKAMWCIYFWLCNLFHFVMWGICFDRDTPVSHNISLSFSWLDFTRWKCFRLLFPPHVCWGWKQILCYSGLPPSQSQLGCISHWEELENIHYSDYRPSDFLRERKLGSYWKHYYDSATQNLIIKWHFKTAANDIF